MGRVFISCVLVIFFSANLFSEEVDTSVSNQDNDLHWAVTVYPFTTAYVALISQYFDSSSPWIYISAEMEYKLNRFLSLPAEMRYYHFTFDEILSDNVISVNIFAIGPGLRLYPQGVGMKGFFIGHYIQFMFGNISGSKDFDEINKSVYVGLPKYYLSTTWLGYRWQFDSFHFELSAGVLGYFPVTEKNAPEGAIVFAGFGMGFGTSF